MSISQKTKGISWSWGKYLALVLLVILVISPFLLYLGLSGWNQENIELEQPRTFHMAIGLSYGTAPLRYVASHPDDFEIDLTITYPRSTLIVGDAINISGIGLVISNPPTGKIISLTVGFEYAQEFPFTQIDNITQSSNLFIDEVGDTNTYVGNATAFLWQLEGTYHPLVAYTIHNDTGNWGFGPFSTSQAGITVYPKTQIAQTLTNNVEIILTVAFFLLTIVGTGSLILTLWDRKTSTDKSESQAKENNTTSNTEDDNGKSEKQGKTEDSKKKNKGEKVNNNTTDKDG